MISNTIVLYVCYNRCLIMVFTVLSSCACTGMSNSYTGLPMTRTTWCAYRISPSFSHTHPHTLSHTHTYTRAHTYTHTYRNANTHARIRDMVHNPKAFTHTHISLPSAYVYVAVEKRNDMKLECVTLHRARSQLPLRRYSDLSNHA